MKPSSIAKYSWEHASDTTCMVSIVVCFSDGPAWLISPKNQMLPLMKIRKRILNSILNYYRQLTPQRSPSLYVNTIRFFEIYPSWHRRPWKHHRLERRGGTTSSWLSANFKPGHWAQSGQNAFVLNNTLAVPRRHQVLAPTKKHVRRKLAE